MSTPDGMQPLSQYAADQVDSATHFLELMLRCPDLAPPAPNGSGLGMANLMEHRALLGNYECLRCGVPADVAFILHSNQGPRWLDLCKVDAHFVTKAAEQDIWSDKC